MKRLYNYLMFLMAGYFANEELKDTIEEDVPVVIIPSKICNRKHKSKAVVNKKDWSGYVGLILKSNSKQEQTILNKVKIKQNEKDKIQS